MKLLSINTPPVFRMVCKKIDITNRHAAGGITDKLL